MNQYYSNKNQSLLNTALKEVEQSLPCPGTRKAAVELKIGLLSLQKKFATAYTFIDSLTDADFKYDYTKAADYNFFRAMEYESKADIANRDKFLSKAVAAVKEHINKENARNNHFDLESYYTLFFFKKMYVSSQSLETELDLLKRKYPDHVQDLEGIKQSIRSHKTSVASNSAE